eukprot:TRINITY_DN7013_c0_g1_i3.p1 TRINITY_DN7013_c0_g1~~TRINITY_DN7013_c0_g1_i3.p1  ORF type:complete len:573 (+),score=178.86 TRINITY_DN7013_c0_g1_i3:58-1776(+)
MASQRREAHKRQQALEEARKLGTVPALQDEEGRDINPHIPQYITNVPFFYGDTGPTLKHQRVQPDQEKHFDHLSKKAKRGLKKGPRATRYRKGACENCGSMTHKRADCLERPRKLGARYTGKNIAADEYIPEELSQTYDGKRDRWQDYDGSDYQQVLREHELIEAEKRKQKLEQLKQQAKEAKEAKLKSAEETGEDKADKPKVDPGADEASDDSDDEDDKNEDDHRYSESADMAGSKVDMNNRMTVRNLRIREDTAKYLLNLDVNSAHYDPKSRAMRANPLKGSSKQKTSTFAGENFVRYTGEVTDIAERQLFAWDASGKGVDVHLQADPTKAELLHKNFENKKQEFQESQKQSILEKYGGAEHLQAPPKELLLAQTEHYVEYSQSGRVVKGNEKAKVQSRYEEDVHPGNHTSVWGSFWSQGRWGYACCHSTERNSYCTGAAGRQARAAKPTDLLELKAKQAAAQAEAEAEPQESLVAMHQKNKGKKGKRSKEEAADADEDDDEARLARIKAFQKKHKAAEKEAERLMKMDERARPFNSGRGDDQQVTEEEMEAWRLAQQREEDPMAKFLSK